MKTLLLPILLALVVVASLIEAAVMSWRDSYDWKAMGVSLVDLVVRNALLILLPVSVADPLVHLAERHRLFEIPLTTWQAFLALFIGQEFCYYWYHRASHRIRWFWLNHQVHHTPNTLNLSAAYRTSIFGKLTGTALFFVPLIWLGFPPKAVGATLALNLLYQFWLHTTWIPRLGWLEYVLNTPSAHRVHHGANLEYLDANYGGVLIVFDRLFGTYVAERPELPCRYGLVHPQTSYNPLRVEFDPWRGLWHDLRRARSLRAVLGHLFMPPGWQPDGRGDTTDNLRRRAATS